MALSLEAVVFDLDGTLVHSSPDIAHHMNVAFSSCLKIEGPFSENNVEMLIGGGLKDVISRGFEKIGHPADDALFNEVLTTYRQIYLDAPVIKTTLYEGVLKTLSDLQNRGIAIGLCTNKTEATARKVLDHFDLTSFFGAIVGGDTMPTRKPEPESLLHAIDYLKAMPHQAVMVGDSKADFGAARNAKTPIILVDWGYSAVDITTLGADALISHYDHLNPALAKCGFVV